MRNAKKGHRLTDSLHNLTLSVDASFTGRKVPSPRLTGSSLEMRGALAAFQRDSPVPVGLHRNKGLHDAW